MQARIAVALMPYLLTCTRTVLRRAVRVATAGLPSCFIVSAMLELNL